MVIDVLKLGFHVSRQSCHARLTRIHKLMDIREMCVGDNDKEYYLYLFAKAVCANGGRRLPVSGSPVEPEKGLRLISFLSNIRSLYMKDR